MRQTDMKQKEKKSSNSKNKQRNKHADKQIKHRKSKKQEKNTFQTYVTNLTVQHTLRTVICLIGYRNLIMDHKDLGFDKPENDFTFR